MFWLLFSWNIIKESFTEAVSFKRCPHNALAVSQVFWLIVLCEKPMEIEVEHFDMFIQFLRKDNFCKLLSSRAKLNSLIKKKAQQDDKT